MKESSCSTCDKVPCVCNFVKIIGDDITYDYGIQLKRTGKCISIIRYPDENYEESIIEISTNEAALQIAEELIKWANTN